MKPAKQTERPLVTPRHDQAPRAFFFCPRFESAQQMRTVTFGTRNGVPSGLKRGRVAGEIMRREHTAEEGCDRIAGNKKNAVRIAYVRDGKPGEFAGASSMFSFFFIEALAKLNEAGDVFKGPASNTGPVLAHVASLFCDRNTANRALIAFAASAAVASSVTLGIAAP